MDILERIKTTVQTQPIVLFMKGTPQYPMDAASACAVEVLQADGAQFLAVNILADPELRASLKRFSNWPTFPQMFIHGELIGGCDIAVELHESGELAGMVRDVNAMVG